MGRALERGRAGEGPYALEIVCSRFLGHFVGDPQAYRLPEELAQARANDPLARFRTGVTETSPASLYIAIMNISTSMAPTMPAVSVSFNAVAPSTPPTGSGLSSTIPRF